MADDSSRNRDADPPSSFEEWVDRQASAEDISRDELFQQLLSSYWTLNEMSQLLDETAQNNPLFRTGRASGEGGDPNRTAPPTEPPRPGRDDVSESQIEELQNRVAVLQEELQKEVERSTRIASRGDSLADRIGELEAELEELESLSEARASEIQTELRSIESEVSAEQDRLRDRLETEFDDLQTILEYLVETSDELDSRLSKVQQQQRVDVERFQEALNEFEAEQALLRQLMREAIDIGEQTARCEHCSKSVDLSLLVNPYCPQCDRQLVGVEAETRWFFFSDPVLKTSDSKRAEIDVADLDASRAAPSENSPVPDGEGFAPGDVDNSDGDGGQESADLTLDLPSEPQAGGDSGPLADESTTASEPTTADDPAAQESGDDPLGDLNILDGDDET